MLKVEPRFRLDRAYKGPFQIMSLTSTNAVIELRNDNNVEASGRDCPNITQKWPRPPLG